MLLPMIVPTQEERGNDQRFSGLLRLRSHVNASVVVPAGDWIPCHSRVGGNFAGMTKKRARPTVAHVAPHRWGSRTAHPNLPRQGGRIRIPSHAGAWERS